MQQRIASQSIRDRVISEQEIGKRVAGENAKVLILTRRVEHKLGTNTRVGIFAAELQGVLPPYVCNIVVEGEVVISCEQLRVRIPKSAEARNCEDGIATTQGRWVCSLETKLLSKIHTRIL